jgi:hypothetical protein
LREKQDTFILILGVFYGLIYIVLKRILLSKGQQVKKILDITLPNLRWKNFKQVEFNYLRGEVMKKTFLFIVLSLMISTSAYAQSFSQQWVKTYSGGGNDVIYSIQQTMDGGYIAVGHTDSFAGFVYEAWIVKLDANGDISWQKTYRPSGWLNTALTVQQTNDGGYILGGYGGTYDFPSWILKLDAEGDAIWQKAYSEVVEFISIQQTADGGYIAGADSNFGIVLIKFDENGDVIWQKACSGDATDDIYSLQMTSDGGYIVVRAAPVVISKLDSGGNIIWQKTYNEGVIVSIQQVSDGGYILAGKYDSDAWVLRLDENGNSVWQKAYSGGFASFIQQNPDGGYTVIGSKRSDVWFLKLDSNGSIIWQKTYGVELRHADGLFVANTMDGGHFLASNVSGYPMLLKLDSNGELPNCDIIGNSYATVSDVVVDSYDINASYQSEPITIMALDIMPQDNFVETTVVCQYNDPNDIDGDGVANNPDEDNCPTRANGPFLGTCTVGNVGDSCIANEACGVGGICSMNQEDADGDGIGDACDSSGAQVPTLSEWGLMIFMTLVMGIGVITLLRRKMV